MDNESPLNKLLEKVTPIERRDADPSQPTPMTPSYHCESISVVHQLKGENPTAVQLMARYNTQSDESPYSRRFNITPGGPVPFDFGFIQDPHTIVVENRTGCPGPNQPPKPTSDPVRVFLRYRNEGGQGWEILPGAFFIGVPTSKELVVEAVGGVASIRLHVYPK
jgi:hypothetical protein